ncbi:hypothetical protein A7U60_g8187 [Sanghuangporus baumii]|uniref:Uncharacterized protein n=1 Tax=Sanghuangporus baumii TaxID=108892 RepID=A0A9Q5HRV1_SANBA|nr:hypothetical protein A7U60_g8187 [Sanghuangporus baumii]
MAVPRDAAATVNGSSNSDPGPSTSSAISTLRSLYPRAAHALLQRDFALTHALIESAFELLPPPPPGFRSAPDALDTHRRKWEILRITLETSAYASPPSSSSSSSSSTKRIGVGADVLPPALRANLMLSAPGLITALHSRSVRLFTPRQQSPKAAFLPAQILVPLILSSVKLECPDVGRSMIEDWLAQRGSVDSRRSDAKGYERILELYCLHVLPRLHEWEYAQEFLEYESELPEYIRQHFKTTLCASQTQEIEAARTIPSPPPILSDSSESNSSSSSRTPSPSPSVGSSSSSDTDDTHSTRTVVPHTARAKHGMDGLSPLTPTHSTTSTSSLVAHSKRANGHAGTATVSGKRAASPSSTVHAGTSRSRQHSSRITSADSDHTPGTLSTRNRNQSSTLTLLASTFRAYLAQLGPSRLIFALLCILVPLFSFLARLRKRRRQHPSGLSTSVDAVRRQLAGQADRGIVGTIWTEVVRAVSDAVRMAGSGLV